MVNGKKTYYSISEVCTQTGLEPHVLRYWESEFPQLRPKKNRAGNRAYRDKDIEVIRYIKYLLYDEQFTIPGAKRKISETRDFSEQLKLDIADSAQDEDQEEAAPATAETPAEPVDKTDLPLVTELKEELKEVLKLLKS